LIKKIKVSKGNNVQELGKVFNERTQALINVQTHWAIVKEVDWDKKTMTATGLVDDCDFFDVNLGIGCIHTKPVVGSKCLIGIINNNIADAFMIEAEQIEQIELVDKSGFKVVLNNGKMSFNGESFGGIVNAKELKTQLDKNTKILKAIQNVFTAWVLVPGDGGAALKTASAGFVNLQTANLNNIENDKIKHG
jgi:hypothetical protein